MVGECSLPWKSQFNKRESNKYINEFWGFSLDLGRNWYKPKGFIVWLRHVITPTDALFRQDRFPMQANMIIGPEPGPSSWDKTSCFGIKYMMKRGYEILGVHHITVQDSDHYAISYMLGGLIPTRKYSIVLEHPRYLKQYIEFVFTISVYGSKEDFEQNIGEGDLLVKSFEWL